jgi:hypothetical protein
MSRTHSRNPRNREPAQFRCASADRPPTGKLCELQSRSAWRVPLFRRLQSGGAKPIHHMQPCFCLTRFKLQRFAICAGRQRFGLFPQPIHLGRQSFFEGKRLLQRSTTRHRIIPGDREMNDRSTMGTLRTIEVISTAVSWARCRRRPGASNGRTSDACCADRVPKGA